MLGDVCFLASAACLDVCCLLLDFSSLCAYPPIPPSLSRHATNKHRTYAGSAFTGNLHCGGSEDDDCEADPGERDPLFTPARVRGAEMPPHLTMQARRSLTNGPAPHKPFGTVYDVAAYAVMCASA
jgi:hypothetical protein